MVTMAKTTGWQVGKETVVFDIWRGDDHGFWLGELE